MNVEICISMTKDEWIEVYYAIETKANAIDAGKYGPDGLDGVCNSEWVGQLRSAMDKIKTEVRV